MKFTQEELNLICMALYNLSEKQYNEIIFGCEHQDDYELFEEIKEIKSLLNKIEKKIE